MSDCKTCDELRAELDELRADLKLHKKWTRKLLGLEGEECCCGWCGDTHRPEHQISMTPTCGDRCEFFKAVGGG